MCGQDRFFLAPFSRSSMQYPPHNAGIRPPPFRKRNFGSMTDSSWSRGRKALICCLAGVLLPFAVSAAESSGSVSTDVAFLWRNYHWIFRAVFPFADRHGGLYDPFSGRHTPPSAGRAGIPAPHLSGARPEQSGAPYLGADRQNGESGLFQLPGGRIGADAQCRGKPQLAVGGFKGGSPVAMGISGGSRFL